MSNAKVALGNIVAKGKGTVTRKIEDKKEIAPVPVSISIDNDMLSRVKEAMIEDSKEVNIPDVSDDDIKSTDGFDGESISKALADNYVDSNKGFDSNAVVDALNDNDEPEGGVVKNTTTGEIGMSGTVIVDKPDLRVDNNMFELSGFSIRYNTEDGVVGIESKSFYSTEAEAMNAVSGSNCSIMIKGVEVDAIITDGSPVISIGERQKKQYIDGKWISS